MDKEEAERLQREGKLKGRDEDLCALDDDRYADYDAIGEIEVPEGGVTLSAPLIMGEVTFDVVDPFLTLPPGSYWFVVSPRVGGGPVRLVRYLDYVAAEPAG